MWAESLTVLGPALATAFTLFATERIRVLVRSIFRRPSKPTLLVKAGNTWIDTSDSQILSETELDLLARMGTDTSAADNRDSLNGGAGTNG